jgi:hypothetical membrane protein
MATTSYHAAQAQPGGRPRSVPNRTTQPGHGLDGALLSPTTWALVACGTLGGLLFTAGYLIEGATRPGYDPWGQAISALSLGPGGWMQRVNFIVFGLLMIAAAAGWRKLLLPGAGARAFPLLRAAAGLGLVADGIFSQDPVPGYPPGAVTATATLPGEIHSLFAFVTITALAGSCLVLARRLAREPHWRGWAAAAVATGVLTLVFIAVFGALGAHGGMAGLFERLSGGINSAFYLALVTRLLIQARAGIARHR